MINAFPSLNLHWGRKLNENTSEHFWRTNKPASQSPFCGNQLWKWAPWGPADTADHGAQGWCDLIKSCTDSFVTNSTFTISEGKWCFSREFCSSFLSTPYKAWTTWGKFTILVGRKPKHHSRKKWCPSPQIPCTIIPRKLRCYSKIRHVLTETKRRMSEPCIQPPHSPRLSDWK